MPLAQVVVRLAGVRCAGDGGADGGGGAGGGLRPSRRSMLRQVPRYSCVSAGWSPRSLTARSSGLPHGAVRRFGRAGNARRPWWARCRCGARAGRIGWARGQRLPKAVLGGVCTRYCSDRAVPQVRLCRGGAPRKAGPASRGRRVLGFDRDGPGALASPEVCSRSPRSGSTDPRAPLLRRRPAWLSTLVPLGHGLITAQWVRKRRLPFSNRRPRPVAAMSVDAGKGLCAGPAGAVFPMSQSMSQPHGPEPRAAKRRWYLRAWFIVAAALAVVAAVAAMLFAVSTPRMTARGTVIDRLTGQPVAAARLHADRTSAVTNARGMFRMDGLVANAALRVDARYYDTAEVKATATPLTVRLTPIPVRIAVTSALTGRPLAAQLAMPDGANASARADGTATVS